MFFFAVGPGERLELWMCSRGEHGGGRNSPEVATSNTRKDRTCKEQEEEPPEPESLGLAQMRSRALKASRDFHLPALESEPTPPARKSHLGIHSDGF